MKLLNIDWWQFFQSLELYEKLPAETRKVFIQQVKPSQPTSRNMLGLSWPELIQSGLMALSQTGVNANVKPEHREFSRAMRAMSRTIIFAAASRDTFLNYLNDNLTSSETAALGGAYLYGRMAFEGLQRLYSLVASTGWTKDFLSAKNSDWERDYADPAQPRYFTSPDVLKAAQAIVRAASESEGPVPLKNFPAFCPGVAPETFSAAVRAVLRYLLIYPALRSETLEPIAGLWPGVAGKLSSKPPAPPVPVETVQDFESPFIVGDMVSLLSACIADPPRLRSGDMQIFEADRKNLTNALGSIPDWVEGGFHDNSDQRIARAFEFLSHYGFVDRSGRPGSEFRLKATTGGSEWIALDPKDRLRTILDGMRPAKKPFKLEYPSGRMSLVPGVAYSSRADAAKIVPAVIDAYASAPVGAALRLSDFLDFRSRAQNPVMELARKDRYFSMNIAGSWINQPSEEELEMSWQNTLAGFLATRLLPLGGVRLGVEKGGDRICFTLTDIGRYLIGVLDDFELPREPDARILVQPNFDVVFLSPSATVEAQLARFCERKGRHIGTLFRITRTSVMTAAAAGMTLEEILQSLNDYCPAGVPANVSSEITGWFRRFREVRVRPAVVVHCPDEETAAIVMGAIGKKVIQLTPTVLEIMDSKIQPAVAKKLREAGIFIKSDAKSG